MKNFCAYCNSRFEANDYTEVCEECSANTKETDEMLAEVRGVLQE
jgi:hypothetical protein